MVLVFLENLPSEVLLPFARIFIIFTSEKTQPTVVAT